MTESKDLVLVNEQLRRSIRRWKALALTSCATLAFVLLFGLVAAYMARVRANHNLREAKAALASALQARLEAQWDANPGRAK